MKIENFSGKLEALLKKHGMNQAQLAEKANITERHVSRVKKCDDIPESFLNKICNALDVPINVFYDFRTVDDDYFPVPFREASGSMGRGSYVGSKKIISHISLRKNFLLTKTNNLESLSFIHSAGESMSPTIPPDAAVLIDESQIEPINNKIYYMLYNGSYLIKRVEVKNGRLVSLISDNSGKKIDIGDDDQIEILGRAILQQTEL